MTCNCTLRHLTFTYVEICQADWLAPAVRLNGKSPPTEAPKEVQPDTNVDTKTPPTSMPAKSAGNLMCTVPVLTNHSALTIWDELVWRDDEWTAVSQKRERTTPVILRTQTKKAKE